MFWKKVSSIWAKTCSRTICSLKRGSDGKWGQTVVTNEKHKASRDKVEKGNKNQFEWFKAPGTIVHSLWKIHFRREASKASNKPSYIFSVAESLSYPMKCRSAGWMLRLEIYELSSSWYLPALPDYIIVRLTWFLTSDVLKNLILSNLLWIKFLCTSCVARKVNQKSLANIGSQVSVKKLGPNLLL